MPYCSKLQAAMFETSSLKSIAAANSYNTSIQTAMTNNSVRSTINCEVITIIHEVFWDDSKPYRRRTCHMMLFALQPCKMDSTTFFDIFSFQSYMVAFRSLKLAIATIFLYYSSLTNSITTKSYQHLIIKYLSLLKYFT